MTDKSVLEKKSIIKFFKLLNKYAGAISILSAILLVITKICVSFYDYGKLYYLDIKYKGIVDYEFSLSDIILYIPISLFVILITNILLILYGKEKHKKNSKLSLCIGIALLTIVYSCFIMFLINIEQKKYIIPLLINFILLLLYKIIYYFLQCTNCNKSTISKKILSSILIYKYLTIFFICILSPIFLMDVNVLNYNLKIIFLGLILSIIVILSLITPITLFMSFIAFFDYLRFKIDKKIIKRVLNAVIDKKYLLIIAFIFLYCIIAMFFMGYNHAGKNKSFIKINFNDPEGNILERNSIILYETTDMYIVADYIEIGDNEDETIIYNKKLKYISKSENVSVEKIELKNIKLESRMDKQYTNNTQN